MSSLSGRYPLRHKVSDIHCGTLVPLHTSVWSSIRRRHESRARSLVLMASVGGRCQKGKRGCPCVWSPGSSLEAGERPNRIGLMATRTSTKQDKNSEASHGHRAILNTSKAQSSEAVFFN